MDCVMKRCKVFPKPNAKYISGVLSDQKKIIFPSELPLSLGEIRRCLSYADVYEMPEGKGSDKCVLLGIYNFDADNSKAEAATDVPDVELEYPRDEEDDTETDNDQGKESNDGDSQTEQEG